MSDHYPIGYIPPNMPVGVDQLRKELITNLYQLYTTNGCAGYWNIVCFKTTEKKDMYAVLKAEMMEELNKLKAKIKGE